LRISGEILRAFTAKDALRLSSGQAPNAKKDKNKFFIVKAKTVKATRISRRDYSSLHSSEWQVMGWV
jgi:hypothetical protein